MNRENALFNRLVFCTAVREGSLRRAAETMGLSPADAAAGLKTLEREAGGPLLERTPTGVRPTLLGRRWFTTCNAPLQRLSGTIVPDNASQKQFTISMPTTTGTTLLFPRIAAFAARYPNLRLDVRFTHGSYHPLWDGTDLRIAHGNYRLEAVNVTPLGSVRRVAVARPDYFEHHAPVLTPLDLIRPDVFGARDSVETGSITLIRNHESVRLNLTPAVTVRNHLAAMSAALAGAGIALQVPLYLAEEKIRTGRLIQLIPDWEFPPLPLKAFTAQGSIPQTLAELTADLQMLFRESSALIGVKPCGFVPN